MVSNKKKTATNVVKAVAKPISEIAQQAVEENKEAKKPSVMQAIGQTALEVAKTAVPTALSAIPVAGPILGSLASKLMSTLNDDEWFEEFKSAGATFNEMLKSEHVGLNSNERALYKASIANVFNFVGALGTYHTMINLGDDVKNNVFPAFLAYVRKKTNNVLVDSVDQYWYAFGASIQLHAIYYNLEKYLKFAHELPLNAPTCNQVLPAASPLTHSQLCGIRDTLKDFLKTSTGIPYALASYLRWRFGSIFLSENSAKAGLITYDIINVYSDSDAYPIPWNNINTDETTAANTFVAAIQTAINALKTQILSMGRANADIKLAFADHAIKYDVEERHYDEKEFNLRTNLTREFDLNTLYDETVRLLLDSRLKVSEAIQAVTLSTLKTGNNHPGSIRLYPATRVLYGTTSYGQCLFPVFTNYIYTIRPNISGTAFISAFVNGCRVDPTLDWCVLSNSMTQMVDGGNHKEIITANVSYDANDSDAITFENLGLHTYAKADINQYVRAFIYNVLAISMQMHYNNTAYVLGVGIPSGSNPGEIELIQSNPLSYDIAYITDSQLDAIQRMATRNLFRGNYTRKAEQPKQQVAEAISDLVDAATDDAKVKTI
jgi:hypothetical protein